MAYLSSSSLVAQKRVLDRSVESLTRKITTIPFGPNYDDECVKASELLKERAFEIGRLYGAKCVDHDNIDAPVLLRMIEMTHIQLPKGDDEWVPVESQSSGSSLYFKRGFSETEIIEVNPYHDDTQISFSKKTKHELRFGKVIIFGCNADREDEHAIYRTEAQHEEFYLYRHRDGTIRNLAREFSLYEECGSSFFCGQTLHILFQPHTPLIKIRPRYYSLCHQIRDGKTHPRAYMTYEGHIPCSEFIFRGRLYARRHIIDAHDIFTPVVTTIDTPCETFDVKSGETVDFFDFLGKSVHDQHFFSKNGFIYTVKNNVLHILE